MPIIENYEVSILEFPLKEVFKTALREVSSISVIRLTLNRKHFGDAVETKAITGDTKDLILEELNRVAPTLVGRESTLTVDDLDVSQSSKCAIEMALQSMEGCFQNPVKVRTDVTIPIAEISDYETIFTSRIDAGFTSFKVKLSNEPVDLLLGKMAKARLLAGNAPLRVDPNQSWDIDLALKFLDGINREGINIDYLEQPTPARDFDALAAIRKNCATRIMADESCFTAEDLHRLIDLDAIDYVNLKLLKNGGLDNCLHIAEIAKAANVRISVGTMMESPLGVAYAARLAQQLQPDFIHDLDAAWWLKDSPLKYEDGYIIEEGAN